jgi:hypothetical protein
METLPLHNPHLRTARGIGVFVRIADGSEDGPACQQGNEPMFERVFRKGVVIAQDILPGAAFVSDSEPGTVYLCGIPLVAYLDPQNGRLVHQSSEAFRLIDIQFPDGSRDSLAVQNRIATWGMWETYDPTASYGGFDSDDL